MSLATIVYVTGRVLLALLFVGAGITKITGPKPFLDHMQQEHVPKFLFPAVIALEIAAGLALAVGWHVQIAAGALAVFCVTTALIFHRNFQDRAERTQFVKDLAIAGALAMLAA
jgi:putative oxidoreductase